MSQREDPAEYARRMAEIKRQHEEAEAQAFADRMAAQRAIAMGLPSPRAREAAAGPLVWRDGPKITEMREIRTGHHVPRNQSHHVLDGTGSCWCGPREEPRAPDGERTWTHFAIMPAERRVEGAAPAVVEQTVERLDDARRRGEL